MAYNPFETPTIYTPQQAAPKPWWETGGGAPAGSLPGIFPAAPVMGQPSPGQQSLLGLPSMDTPQPAPAMMQPQEQNPMSGLGDIIGRLFGMGPNRAERNKAAMGQARSSGLQELGDLVASGVPGPQAILQFIKTPKGAAFVANSNDPAGEMKQFLGITATDPTAAIRTQAFGPDAGGAGSGAGGGVDPTTGQPINPDLAPGRTQVEYLKSAEYMAQHGDEEGAKIAVSMAEEARQAAALQEAPYDEPSIKRYNAYVQQENAAGRHVDSYDTWLSRHTKEGVMNAANEPINPAILTRVFAKIDAAEKSESAIQSYETYALLAKGIDTNWLKGATLPLQEGLRSIGFTFNEDVPILESMTALSNKLALGARGYSELSGEVGLPGTTSNKDLSFLVNSVPNVWNTSLANEVILIIMTAQARRQSLLASAEANYLADNNTPSGWMEERRDLIQNTPMFSDEEMGTLKSLNEQARGMPKMVTPESRMGDIAPMPDTFFPDDSLDVRQDAWNELHKNDAPTAQPPINTEPAPDAQPAPKSPKAKKAGRVR